jgi:outer membrane immunogenic protein
MNVKMLLGGVALSIVLASPVAAADLRRPMPVKAPPAPAPIAYNWSGLYIGGHGGGGFSEKCFTSVVDGLTVDDGCHDGDGWLAGGQVGFNWQTGQFVFGIEFSGSAADISGSHAALADPDFTWDSDINSIFLLTGRIGLAFDRLLLYVNGGGAWVREELTGTFIDGTVDSLKKNRSGWTVGAGIEFGLAPNWSIAAQYNFVDLGDKDVFLPLNDISTNAEQQIHLVTGRINYRFNWGGGAPVAARY